MHYVAPTSFKHWQKALIHLPYSIEIIIFLLQLAAQCLSTLISLPSTENAVAFPIAECWELLAGTKLSVRYISAFKTTFMNVECQLQHLPQELFQ